MWCCRPIRWGSKIVTNSYYYCKTRRNFAARCVIQKNCLFWVSGDHFFSSSFAFGVSIQCQKVINHCAFLQNRLSFKRISCRNFDHFAQNVGILLGKWAHAQRSFSFLVCWIKLDHHKGMTPKMLSFPHAFCPHFEKWSKFRRNIRLNESRFCNNAQWFTTF